MEEKELRIGNWVNTIDGITKVDDVLEFGINMNHDCWQYDLDKCKPIPLTVEWCERMKNNANKSPFPDWIKYVHEAQNWYYWNNNKTELKIDFDEN